MSLMDYKTKSFLFNRSMSRINGNNQHLSKTVVAIDCGYSAVKGVTANIAFQFPSYAKKVAGELEAVVNGDNFNYQLRNNKTGEYWLVGNLAEDMQNTLDIEGTTDSSVYSRYRYNSPMYNALMSVGIGLALLNKDDTKAETEEIYLQCGLPATYKDRDTNALIDAIAIDYDFSLKVGANPWATFKFTIPKDHAFVMEQPQGTLCSIGYGMDKDLGKDILHSNSLILDIGFGTEDIFSIRSGFKNSHSTEVDTAMKSVFDEVVNQLKKEYPIEIKTFEIQKYLKLGKIPYFDCLTNTYECIPEEVLANAIEKANRTLCDKSINRLISENNHLIDYKYLIVTGGTGESRFEQIKEKLSGLTSLTVLAGNHGDPSLPFTFSNVLGYYTFRYMKLMRALTA